MPSRSRLIGHNLAVMTTRGKNRTSLRHGCTALVVGLTAILMVGCGDDDDETTTASTTTTATETASGGSESSESELEGTVWLLTADAPLGAALESIGVTAEFADGDLTGQSGCNRYRTTYELDGSSLTIGPDIAGTLIACPPAETAVETAYLERLPRVAAYEVDGDTLLLSDADGEALLSYRMMDGAESIQGAWTVTSYYAGTAVVSVLGGATLTAEFAEGTVSGNTGCNTFTGPYEIDGTSIDIGTLAVTLSACETEELQTQEANYLAALELAATFQVVGNRLDLFRDDGAYAVSYQSG
jgi:heat shock protein HslJ